MTPPAPRTASASPTDELAIDGLTSLDVDVEAPADVDDEVDSDVAGPVGLAPAPRAATAAPATVPTDEIADGLTDRERQIIAFERQWWKHAGAKEQAIRDLFEVSSTRYYQMVNALLDNPAALAYDPVLIRRLRRLRATRSRARSAGRRSA